MKEAVLEHHQAAEGGWEALPDAEPVLCQR
jgi:hypothetical protein